MKRLAALAAFKLSVFLKNRVPDGFFARYSRLIQPDLTEEELRGYSEEPDILFADDPRTVGRYRKIYELLGGDPIALTALELALLAEMDGQAVSLLGEFFGTGHFPLNIAAAARISARDRECIEIMPQIRRAYGRVRILLQAKENGEGFLYAPFQTDGRIAAWLAGEEEPDDRISFCSLWRHGEELPRRTTGERELREQLQGMRSDAFSVLLAGGEEGSGRRFLMKHAAAQLHREILFVPAKRLIRDGGLCRRPWLLIQRELLLGDAMLCICGFGDGEEESDAGYLEALEEIGRDYQRLNRPLLLTADAQARVQKAFDVPVRMVRIGEYTMQESCALWIALAGELGMDARAIPAKELAAGMTLTAGQMKRALSIMKSRERRGAWSAREIYRICYEVLDDGRYRNVSAVKLSYSWEDLKVDAYTERILRNICDQARCQMKVLCEWELEKYYPYGRSISALFSGPPGTGKTMAAQVAARALGLELYRVDLSQIVDKYIGETEKRLKEVFDRAERSNMVLLFDEADALLGKRSDIRDSRDRYANTEVAYLLQRMEEYRGVVLMTTNLVSNIDNAFLRRFRYHAVFARPDARLRREIWSAVLKKEIPQSGVDLNYLSEQFELSGAQIKNIALNACYLAAADGGTLEMKHLILSIFYEGKKEGQLMLASEFGVYGERLQQMIQEGSGK